MERKKSIIKVEAFYFHLFVKYSFVATVQIEGMGLWSWQFKRCFRKKCRKSLCYYTHAQDDLPEE